MISRAIASKVSVVLSLGLIVVVVFAFLGKSQRQPPIVPAAVPANDETTAASVPAQPRVPATLPVVLPPPPAPAPRPSPDPLPARATQAPQPAEPEQKPPSTETVQSKEPGGPSPATEAKVSAAHPRTPDTKPTASRQPPRRAAQEAPDRPSHTARPSLKVKGATAEGRGKSITASQSDVAGGRTLLRLLEFGSGPTIELAWPIRPGIARACSRCWANVSACRWHSWMLTVASTWPKASRTRPGI